MEEIDYLHALYELLTVMACFQIAHFGWMLYRAFCGGMFRLDRFAGWGKK